MRYVVGFEEWIALKKKIVAFAAAIGLGVNVVCPATAAAEQHPIDMSQVERIRDFENGQKEKPPFERAQLRSSQEDIPEFSASASGIIFELADGTQQARLSAGSESRELETKSLGSDNWILAPDALYREMPDGAAAYSIISSNSDSVAWELDLPEEVSAYVTTDGEVEFRRHSPSGVIVYDAKFETPWAIDENGRQVRTWYESANGQLIQRVDRSESKGEILVDPRLSYGMGVYFNAWGTEMTGYHRVLVGGVNTAAVAACAINKLPNMLKPLLIALCGIGGINMLDVVDAIKAVPYYDPSKCYQLKVVRFEQGSRPVPVGAHECRA